MLPLDATQGKSEMAGPSLAERVGDTSSLPADERIQLDERKQLVRETIATLSEQQRTVLALCYDEELSLRQIAEVLQVTESRVSQIRSEAPQVTATIQRYLQRLAAFLAPASVSAAENALRQFARWLVTDAGLDSIAAALARVVDAQTGVDDQ